jgi:hypothetical protein
MEVGQGQNWGCSAKEEKKLTAAFHNVMPLSLI